MPMQRWLIAASLAATVGAGLFALRVHEVAPPMAATVPSRAAAPPPPAPPASPAPRMQAFKSEPAAEQDAPAPPKPSAPALSKNEALRSLGYTGREARMEPARGVEGGVVGGVVGGSPGGVVSGVVGGTPAPVPSPPAAVPKPDQEITVAAESPLLDERRISAGATVSQTELEKIPTSRDPRAVGELTERNSTVSQKELEKIPTSRDPWAVLQAPPKVLTEFKSKAVNPFVETAKDRLSTFGLDVDTASYTVARQYLNGGRMPVPESIRVEEMVNFFDYGDPAPTQGDFAIKAEGGPTPFTQGAQYRLVRFNLRGREVRMDNRRPVVLTFLIDASGSMEQPNRLPLVKQSLSLLLDQLRPTDRIGLVVFGSVAHVLLEPTSDREAVRQAIGKLAYEGATNIEDGLAVAYDVAGKSFQPNASNRIILCSDGEANVGRSGPQAILGRIGREARRGIELTTLGFGMGDYNDNLMEQLADKGDGRYAFIDTLDEARRVLVEEVSGTLNTIAKDAKTQVEFNPAVVARYRLLGYENRAIADERFRDDRVIAGQIGSGHSVTALYEVELRPDAPRDGVVATLRLRYRTPVIGNVTETEKRLHLFDLAPTWEKASPAFRLSALVAQFAEILKGSPWAKGDLAEVARQVQNARKALPKSAASGRFGELAELAGKAAKLAGEKEER